MSVAPGSGVGSFKVLYIALIYMSLEINLAYTLPRHPPPPPPPLWTLPPSPSGLGLHLSFPLALRGRRRLGRPRAAPAAVGVQGSLRWALSPGAVAAVVAAAGWGGQQLPGGGDAAGGPSRGMGCRPRAPPGGWRGGLGSSRGAGQGEGMAGHLRDEHGLVFTVWKRRSGC